MFPRLCRYLRTRLGFGGFEPAGDYDPAMMARAGFYLYVSGAIIGLLVLLLPAQGRDRLGMTVIALSALALGYFELIAFDRLPLWAFQALSVCGTLLTAAAVHEAGTTSEIYQLLYVWVVLYAAYFFSLRAFLAQIAVIGTASGLVAWTLDAGSFGWMSWALRNLTFAVAGFLVYALRRRWLSLLAIERERVAKLQELDRLKDEFIVTASHELRTPVTSLYGAAQTLALVAVDEETRGRLLAIIGREAERLSSKMDAILQVGRLHAGTTSANIQPCELGVLVREAVDAAVTNASASAGSEGDREGEAVATLVFTLEIPERLIVDADAGQLRQALDNLLDNAIKYSPHGGTIAIAVARTVDRGRGRGRGIAQVVISDEGIGIAPGEEEAVFEKFYRADPEMKRGIGGAGLGLSISRQLIEGMNGSVFVRRRPEGGLAAVLELPLVGSAID